MRRPEKDGLNAVIEKAEHNAINESTSLVHRDVVPKSIGDAQTLVEKPANVSNSDSGSIKDEMLTGELVAAAFRSHAIRPTRVDLERMQRSDKFGIDPSLHAHCHEILAEIPFFNMITDKASVAFMGRNWQKIPDYVQKGFLEEFIRQRASNYQHIFHGTQLPHSEIKSLLATSRNASAWVHDEVINYYLGVVAHTAKMQAISSLLLVANRKDPIYYRTNAELCAINVGEGHWIVCVVNVSERILTIMDSLGPEGQPTPARMRQYEAQTQKLRYFLQFKSTITNVNEWQHKYVFLQKQDDGVNCGIFVMQIAKCVCLRIRWRKITDTNSLRQKMLYEISEGCLLPW